MMFILPVYEINILKNAFLIKKPRNSALLVTSCIEIFKVRSSGRGASLMLLPLLLVVVCCLTFAFCLWLSPLFCMKAIMVSCFFFHTVLTICVQVDQFQFIISQHLSRLHSLPHKSIGLTLSFFSVCRYYNTIFRTRYQKLRAFEHRLY